MKIDPPYIDNFVKYIEDRVKSGDLPPGTWLPSIPQLAREHGMKFASTRAAMQRLKDRGVLRSHPGKGFYVPDK